MISELVGTANWSWGMYPGLSHGAMNTINMHGTDEQKSVYLTKLVAGTWTGTMCLTEPQAGSSLSDVTTAAIPQEDGSYAIKGQKIFINTSSRQSDVETIAIVIDDGNQNTGSVNTRFLKSIIIGGIPFNIPKATFFNFFNEGRAFFDDNKLGI